MSHAAWLQQAESDLSAAKVLSAADHHAQAVWLAAQAVEKAHKAILVALGLRYEDRHFKHLGHSTGEISKLLPEGLHEPLDPQIAGMVASLERRSATSRYPAPSPSPPGAMVAPATSFTDSRLELDDADRLLDWCRKRIERAQRATAAMKP